MAVTIFSVAAVLYAAELVLAVFFASFHLPLWPIDRASDFNRERIRELVRETGGEIDARHHTEILAEFRRRKIDAVQAILLADVLGSRGSRKFQGFANVDDLLPLGGVSNALTVLCNESGQYVTYESDEHGFRNPRGIWSSARADLAIVGQSFTQGYACRMERHSPTNCECARASR